MLQHIDFASFSAAGRHVADRPASPSTYSFSRFFSNVRPNQMSGRRLHVNFGTDLLQMATSRVAAHRVDAS
jgi:hypothetical protein